MPEYWAVGWERLCEEGEEKGDWLFACGPITLEEPPKLNTLIKVMEPDGRVWTEYLLTDILGQSSTKFLTALQNLNGETASDLYDMLNEVATVAYEAGWNNITSPQNV